MGELGNKKWGGGEASLLKVCQLAVPHWPCLWLVESSSVTNRKLRFNVTDWTWFNLPLWTWFNVADWTRFNVAHLTSFNLPHWTLGSYWSKSFFQTWNLFPFPKSWCTCSSRGRSGQWAQHLVTRALFFLIDNETHHGQVQYTVLNQVPCCRLNLVQFATFNWHTLSKLASGTW